MNELKESGYLHNHTRMWFASIWIFTLNLPWQLGADLFMQYLKDADEDQHAQLEMGRIVHVQETVYCESQQYF